MIKVEKKGNTTKATVEGSTYVLVDEFQTVLHALYHMQENTPPQDGNLDHKEPGKSEKDDAE